MNCIGLFGHRLKLPRSSSTGRKLFFEGVIKVSESSAMEPERLGPSC